MNQSQIPVARDLMADKLVTLTPDMPAMKAAHILLDNNISGGPVTDGDGKLLGVLSEFDCIREVAARQYHEDFDSVYTVRDVMTGDVRTISPDTDLFGVAHELVTHRIRRLPVVENGKVIGQISRRDVFRALCKFLDKSATSERTYPDYPEGREPIRSYPKAH